MPHPFERHPLLLSCLLFLSLTFLLGATWPNGPDDDPIAAPPNDPGYGRRCRCKGGQTCPADDPETKKYKNKGCLHDRQCGGGKFSCQGRGQWEFWSGMPEEWSKSPDFNKQEIKMGAGIHLDRAWQVTTGDPRIIIAVLDSGIYWENRDLVNKYFLNKKELPQPQAKDGTPAKSHDANGDGIFNIKDYKDDPRVSDKNGNKIIDPGDLIAIFSDGKDDDNNGYIDDISGWDFMWNDNNAADDTRFGHGNGEASDSAAEGNNGIGGLGGCPRCLVLPVRVGDSFVADTNHFALGTIYATDMGAKVIQEALGVINSTTLARLATAYAWKKGALIVASAADETSFHQNWPGNYLHTLYVHAIQHDGNKPENSTTFLNFNNCSNYGGHLALSTSAVQCSSEAVGVTSGHIGLVYAAALKFSLTPPLNAAEVYQIAIMSADDINVPGSDKNPSRYPSGPGWDHHFGYGRNNARRSVDKVRFQKIPPTALITKPLWFQPIYPEKTPTVEIKARIAARRHKSYDYVLEVAPGIRPKDSDFHTLKEEKGLKQPKDLLFSWKVSEEKYDKNPPKSYEPHRFSYTLRLRVTGHRADGSTDKGEHRKTVNLSRDPDLLPAFPLYLDAGGASSPKMADLNKDGKVELIVATENGLVHAFQASGKELKGWPARVAPLQYFDAKHKQNHLQAPAFRHKEIPTTQRQSVVASPAVADIDGDGKLEVVVATLDGSVHVFGPDGKEKPGFPVRLDPQLSTKTDRNNLLEYGVFAAPVLYDLDGDGKLEIVVAAMDAHLYVWRYDGSVQAGFPVLLSDKTEKKPQKARSISTPAIGDVDGDGKPEIFLGTNEIYSNDSQARLYGIHHNGNKNAEGPYLKNWPIKIPTILGNILPLIGRGHPNSPALADMDGDGKAEIIAGCMFFQITVYKADGTRLYSVSNKNFGGGTDSTEKQFIYAINSPAVADLTGNGIPDLLGGGIGMRFAGARANAGIRVDFEHLAGAWYGSDGTFLNGWPRRTEDFQFFVNPTVVDISGDKKPDVLWGSGGYILHAVSAKGVPLPGWPKHTGGWIAASATSGDLTGNGKREVAIITRNGWLFAWKTPGDASLRAEWDSFHHDLRNTGNYHTPLPGRDPNTPPETTKDPPPADGGNTEQTNGSCGCSASSAPESAGLLLLLALLFLQRRRQQTPS